MESSALYGILLGYLLGSIPFTYITAKLVKGIDLREVGSKNVGGTNAIHNIGVGWGLTAGILDVAKGLLAVILTQKIGATFPQNLWAGLAAVAGHNWPVWLRFKGGKGISTTLGLSAWIAFPETLIGFLVGLTTYFLTKKNVIVATLVGLTSIAALMFIFGRPPEAPMIILGSFVIMTVATLPNIINTIRSPEGIGGYFKNPAKDYEKRDSTDNHEQ
jgi:glycerol-3-phosphate acyltransferase PlsY